MAGFLTGALLYRDTMWQVFTGALLYRDTMWQVFTGALLYRDTMWQVLTALYRYTMWQVFTDSLLYRGHNVAGSHCLTALYRDTMWRVFTGALLVEEKGSVLPAGPAGDRVVGVSAAPLPGPGGRSEARGCGGPPTRAAARPHLCPARLLPLRHGRLPPCTYRSSSWAWTPVCRYSAVSCWSTR